MKLRLILVALVLLLTGCGGEAPPPASVPGQAVAPTPVEATAPGQASGSAGTAQPKPLAYSTEQFASYIAKLATVATTDEAKLALGYDSTGRLVVWLSMQRRAPEYHQPGDDMQALATVDQIFTAVPEVQGVWVAHSNPEQIFAYFSRTVYDQWLPRFAGHEKIYFNLNWATLAKPYWKLDPRWGSPITDLWEGAAIGHARALFGSRFVKAEVVPISLEQTGLRIVVRNLPTGNDRAAMEEWARANVALSGRFLHNGYGYFLKELVWVDGTGRTLTQTSARSEYYSTWWSTGLRPGRMLAFASPMSGAVAVNAMQDLEPNRTSATGPWWETAASLEPGFTYLQAKVPGAKVEFLGRQDGLSVATLSLELPATASRNEVWKAQMDAALAAMTAPIQEVWVIVKQGSRVSAAFLDRMAYDAIRYPDKLLPPVTPDVWPFAAALYAEQQ